MRSLQSYLKRKVVVLHEDSKIIDAVFAMSENHIGCVIVCDHSQHLVGMVTDRDLVTRGLALKGESGLSLRLSDVMSRNLIKVEASRSLDEVIHLMGSFGVRRVPIVSISRHGVEKCIGLVTLDDLIADRRIDLSRASLIVRSQMQHRDASLLGMRGPFLLTQQTQGELDQYYESVRQGLGRQLEFNRGEIEELSSIILKVFLRRLHRSAGLHLLSELPRYLYGELLPFVRGPEASANLDFLIAEVCRVFNVDDPTAYQVVKGFCQSLESWCEFKKIKHIQDQLPLELRSLFSETARRAGSLEGERKSSQTQSKQMGVDQLGRRKKIA